MTKLALPPRNAILHGDCINVLGSIATASIDFALTDPPYIVGYKSRDGRRVPNDEHSDWLNPAFAQVHRVLKPGSYCVSFYSWNRVNRFVDAWTAAGFRMVGHLVFRKPYASGGKLLRYTHECAYLLAKGQVTPPTNPLADVIDWKYTGNHLHPTQKPVSAMRPLIEAFCPTGGLVLDPFCGSGSTLVAAQEAGREYLGIEIDPEYYAIAQTRLTTLNLQNAA